jgi:predicted nucleotidyltransferase
MIDKDTLLNVLSPIQDYISAISVNGEKILVILSKVIDSHTLKTLIKENKIAFLPLEFLYREYNKIDNQVNVFLSGEIIFETEQMRGVRVALQISDSLLEKFSHIIESSVLVGSYASKNQNKSSDLDLVLLLNDSIYDAGQVEKEKSDIKELLLQRKKNFDLGNKSFFDMEIKMIETSKYLYMLKTANPVVVQYLKNGIILFDKNLFTMGRDFYKKGLMKATMEGINLFFGHSGNFDEMMEFKFKMIFLEEIHFSVVTICQALLMIKGIIDAPPTEIVELIRKHYLKEEDLLFEDDIVFVERIIQMKEDFKSGARTKITGEELEKLKEDTKEFRKNTYAIKEILTKKYGELPIKNQ